MCSAAAAVAHTLLKWTPRLTHDEEPNGRRARDAHELLAVRLRALLHEVHAVLDELLQRLHDDGVDVRHGFRWGATRRGNGNAVGAAARGGQRTRELWNGRAVAEAELSACRCYAYYFSSESRNPFFIFSPARRPPPPPNPTYPILAWRYQALLAKAGPGFARVFMESTRTNIMHLRVDAKPEQFPDTTVSGDVFSRLEAAALALA